MFVNNITVRLHLACHCSSSFLYDLFSISDSCLISYSSLRPHKLILIQFSSLPFPKQQVGMSSVHLLPWLNSILLQPVAQVHSSDHNLGVMTFSRFVCILCKSVFLIALDSTAFFFCFFFYCQARYLQQLLNLNWIYKHCLCFNFSLGYRPMALAILICEVSNLL